MITKEIIQKLKEASRLATPGPWGTLHEILNEGETNNYIIKSHEKTGTITHYICEGILDNDEAFIALARNHLDELIERVEELENRDVSNGMNLVDVGFKIESLTAENEALKAQVKELEYDVITVSIPNSQDSRQHSIVVRNESSRKVIVETREVDDRIIHLTAQNAKMREALCSIASVDHPDQNKISYWLNVGHKNCAGTLALDTHIARECLADIDDNKQKEVKE